jgi:hypothetical protein
MESDGQISCGTPSDEARKQEGVSNRCGPLPEPRVALAAWNFIAGNVDEGIGDALAGKNALEQALVLDPTNQWLADDTREAALILARGLRSSGDDDKARAELDELSRGCQGAPDVALTKVHCAQVTKERARLELRAQDRETLVRQADAEMASVAPAQKAQWTSFWGRLERTGKRAASGRP